MIEERPVYWEKRTSQDWIDLIISIYLQKPSVENWKKKYPQSELAKTLT